MSALTPAQQDEIRGLWNDDIAFEWSLIRQLVPSDAIQNTQDQVADEMAAEGKVLDRRPGVANLWGGEWGQRAKERLFDRAAAKLREQIRPLEDRLRETVCVDFEYCKKRNQPRFADGWSLAAGIADSMLACLAHAESHREYLGREDHVGRHETLSAQERPLSEELFRLSKGDRTAKSAAIRRGTSRICRRRGAGRPFARTSPSDASSLPASA